MPNKASKKADRKAGCVRFAHNFCSAIYVPLNAALYARIACTIRVEPSLYCFTTYLTPRFLFKLLVTCWLKPLHAVHF